MLTFNKYFAKSIFFPLALISFVLTCVIWVAQIMRLLYLLEGGVSVIDFFKLVSLIIPSLIFYIAPIITLLAVIVTYNKFKEDQQILILQASGLNDLSICKPGLVVASLMAMISLSISAYFMPLSYNALKSRIDYMRDSYISSTITPKRFNQISNDLTLHVKEADELGNISGIVLFDNSNKESRATIFAKYGRVYVEDKVIHFELHDGIRQAYDTNNNLTRLNFDSLKVEIKVQSEDAEGRGKSNLELFIDEMLFPDPDLPAHKQIQFKIEGHMRIIWPMFNIVFAFVFLSLFLKYPFSRKFYWKSIFFCAMPVFLITFIHFSLQKISHNNVNLIFLSYLNVISWMIFSMWKCYKS